MELTKEITDIINTIIETVNTDKELIGRIGEYAVVEKRGNIACLRYTCSEHEEYDTIEEYDDVGWYFPIDKLTYDNFWNVWGEWNGMVCGSIYLDDDYYFSQWNELLDDYEEITLEQLKDKPDGIYKIEA